MEKIRRKLMNYFRDIRGLDWLRKSIKFRLMSILYILTAIIMAIGIYSIIQIRRLYNETDSLSKLCINKIEKMDRINYYIYIDEALRVSKGQGRNTYRLINEICNELRENNIKYINDINIKGNNIYREVKITLIFIIIIIVVCVLIISIWLILSIVSPIRELESKFKELAQKGGDLTQEVNIRSKDEISTLAKSVSEFIKNMRNIMVEVRKNSIATVKSAKKTCDFIGDLNNNVEIITDGLGEVSKGIIITAKTAEDVTESSKIIDSLVKHMEAQGEKGLIAATEITHRANKLQESAKNSSRETMEVYEKSKMELQIALDNSKGIVEIQSFSKLIYDMAHQINLLSLNATIEAARVGEEGKGFVIVAEEIRKLSEKSKENVGQIRDVAKNITNSVEYLIKCSRDILGFMDSTILKDYKNMYSIGEQYNKDAMYVNSLFEEFSATSGKLTLSVKNIMKAMTEVTVAVSEQSSFIHDIEEKASDVLKKSGYIEKEMNNNEMSIMILKNAIDRFNV